MWLIQLCQFSIFVLTHTLYVEYRSHLCVSIQREGFALDILNIEYCIYPARVYNYILTANNPRTRNSISGVQMRLFGPAEESIACTKGSRERERERVSVAPAWLISIDKWHENLRIIKVLGPHHRALPVYICLCVVTMKNVIIHETQDTSFICSKIFMFKFKYKKSHRYILRLLLGNMFVPHMLCVCVCFHLSLSLDLKRVNNVACGLHLNE